MITKRYSHQKIQIKKCAKAKAGGEKVPHKTTLQVGQDEWPFKVRAPTVANQCVISIYSFRYDKPHRRTPRRDEGARPLLNEENGETNISLQKDTRNNKTTRKFNKKMPNGKRRRRKVGGKN